MNVIRLALDSLQRTPLRYMTQRVDEMGGGEVWSTPSRHVISSMSVLMLTPEFSISIICSTVNPACSPATASFPMALVNDGFAIEPSPADKICARIPWKVESVCDPSHRAL